MDPFQLFFRVEYGMQMHVQDDVGERPTIFIIK